MLGVLAPGWVVISGWFARADEPKYVNLDPEDLVLTRAI
jgi:hypothetical protein